MNKNEKKEIIDDVAETFEKDCKKEIGERLEALYRVGSYALHKISFERPDINFLLVFKDKGTPDDFLRLADILRKLIKKYKDKVLIRPDFRPFKSIYPKFRRDYEITINTIIMNTAERNFPVPFNYPKYFLEAIKNSRQLVFGNDILEDVKIGKTTRQHVQEWMIRDILFCELPLARSPVQYDEDEYDLFFNEVFSIAKALCTFGIEAAMSDKELAEKKYVDYIVNKEKMVNFYEKRYSKDSAQMVEKVLDAGENYLKYKNNKEEVKKIFRIALNLAELLKGKLFQGE